MYILRIFSKQLKGRSKTWFVTERGKMEKMGQVKFDDALKLSNIMADSHLKNDGGGA